MLCYYEIMVYLQGKDAHEAFSKTQSLEMILKTEFISKVLHSDIPNDLPEDEVQMLINKGKVNHGYKSK